jgi:hypothetical protein
MIRAWWREAHDTHAPQRSDSQNSAMDVSKRESINLDFVLGGKLLLYEAPIP